MRLRCSCRLECIACTVADRVAVLYAGETIEEACMVHGVDVDTLLDELNSIVALQED